jgi:LCP family protein required for cell wall assembly
VLSFAFIATGILGANVAVDLKLAHIKRISLVESSAASSVQNYLVIGSDSRAFVDNQQDARAFGSASRQGGQRSDTMMIVHVDPHRHRNLVVSIPRDLVLDVPGHGRERVNAAFNDGPQRVIDTIKANFDVAVNHYVEIDFRAFQGIVDAIGRVPVAFPYPARDVKAGLSVGAGCQALDGRQALAYVRSRSLEYLVDGRWRDASPRADLDRIDRQHEFLRKLAETAVNAGMHNPLTASRIVDKIVDKLVVDDKMSRGDILGLVDAFRKVDPNAPGALEMTTLPNVPNGGGTLALKQPDADALLARLRDDGHGARNVASVKPRDVRVQVRNASGVDGLAGRTLAQLEHDGFVGAGTGNAASATTTRISYVPGAGAKASLVQSKLHGAGVLAEDGTLGGDTDVLVVLGTDVGAPAAQHTGTASGVAGGTGATTATTASGASGAAAAPSC